MAKYHWRASRGSTRLDAAEKGVRQLRFYMKKESPLPALLLRSFLRHFCFPCQLKTIRFLIRICFLNKQVGKPTQTLYASHGFVSQWLDHVSADQSTLN